LSRGYTLTYVLFACLAIPFLGGCSLNTDYISSNIAKVRDKTPVPDTAKGNKSVELASIEYRASRPNGLQRVAQQTIIVEESSNWFFDAGSKASSKEDDAVMAYSAPDSIPVDKLFPEAWSPSDSVNPQYVKDKEAVPWENDTGQEDIPSVDRSSIRTTTVYDANTYSTEYSSKDVTPDMETVGTTDTQYVEYDSDARNKRRENALRNDYGSHDKSLSREIKSREIKNKGSEYEDSDDSLHLAEDSMNLSQSTTLKEGDDSLHLAEDSMNLSQSTTLKEGGEKIGSVGESNVASAVLAVDNNSARFLHPLARKGKIVKGYGLNKRGRNDGVDIQISSGSMVYAVDGGTVAFTTPNDNGRFPSVVLVQHANGWMSVYGGVKGLSVDKGQTLVRGEVIGYVASVDGGDGVLHFELRKGTKTVDPELFF